MAQCRFPLFLALCLLLLTPAFSLDLAHIHRLRRQADDVDDDTANDNDDNDMPAVPAGISNDQDDNNNNNQPPAGGGPKFSVEEFGEGLRELLDRDRPEPRETANNPWDSSGDADFTSFLSSLEELADRAPDDLAEFDADNVLSQMTKPGPRQTAQSNQCLKDPVRLQAFLSEVSEAMTELREELMENAQEAAEEALDNIGETNAQDDNDDMTGLDDAAGDGNNNDDAGNDGGMTSPVTQDEDMTNDMDGSSDDLESLDMEDFMENLSEASMECLTGFLDEDDEEALCRQLSHQSSRVFASFLQAGVDCSDYLDEHDDLDDAHQTALLNHMLQKPASSWTSQDLQQALSLAPDVVDDDLIDELPDQVLDDNLDLLGSVAARPEAHPGLQLALRQRISEQDLEKLDSSALTRMGKGLLALSEDELDDLDPIALLNADLDDIFDDDDGDDDDDDSSEADDDDDDEDDDDDDDDEDGQRLALGRRMKEAELTGPRQVGRVARFLYDDLDFLESTDPDDLLEGVEELTGLDLDDDTAVNIFQRMSQSSSFPALNQFSRQDVQRLHTVLPGMSLSQIHQLPKDTIQEALDDLRDVEFGESQARELLRERFDTESSQLTAADVRNLGRLARGLDAEDIEDMDDNLVSEVLDDLGDLDLNDAQKRLLADKALKAASRQGAAKLLTLPAFAEAVSVDDIDDFNDDDIVSSLNVSTAINWRASQASSMVHRVKQTMGGRSLRPADIPRLGTLARGLLPSDLDDIVDRPDDVEDLADVLGDQEDDLSSAQVDKVMELIEERNDIDNLPEIEVTAEFVAQKGVFLAYLPREQFEKLEFDDGGKKAFVSLMAKMDTSKLPRTQLTFLAEQLLEMMEDKVGEDRDDADFRKLRQLGEFALGLSEDRIEGLSAKAVLQNMGVLGSLPLTRHQAEAVMDKVEEAMPDWECKSSVIANVGPLLQFAKEDTIEALCDRELMSSMAVIEKRLEKRQERLEERREEGLWREDSLSAPELSADTPDSPLDDAADLIGDATEDDAGRRLLVARMMTAALASAPAGSAAGGRRRRAVGESLTCGVLRLMRRDVAMVKVSAVMEMTESEFSDCLEVVGNASKWHEKDLGALMQHAQQVVGPPSVWSNEIIRQAGVIVSALTPAEILTLRLTGVDALNSVARHHRMDQAQLRAGFSRWLELKKGNSMAQVTPGEFAAMSEFVCGLTEAQIGQLPQEVFRRSLDVVGKARSCSTGQRSAYVSLALQTYGDVIRHWSPAVVGDMGHLIGGLSSPSIQQLTADQLALIRPAVMANLPVSTLKAMTNTQLRQLSTNQVNSLSRAQYDTLSAEQQSILGTKATVEFKSTAEPHPGMSTETHTSPSTQDVDTTMPDTTTTTMTTTTTTTAAPTTTTSTTTTTTTPKPRKPITTATTTPSTTTSTTTTTTPTTMTTAASTTTTSTTTTTTTLKSTTLTTKMPEFPVSPEIIQTTPAAVQKEDKVASTAAPEVEIPDTAHEKPSELTTIRYVQTTTRKSIAVSTPAADREVSSSSPPIMPDSTRGENPWVKFSSTRPKDTEISTLSNHNNPKSQSNGSGAESENSASSSSSSSKGDKSQMNQRRDKSGSGAASAFSWSVASVLAAVLLSLLFC